MRAFLRLARGAAVATIASACAGGGARGGKLTHGPGIAPPAQHARLELLSSDGHPAIARVNRSGDPMGGVAIAIAHDGGSAASVSLAGLLEARLRTAYPAVITRPHDLGVIVSHLVADAASGARFTQSALAALSTPVGDGDPALPWIHEKLSALSQVQGEAGDDPVRRCSGELARPSAAVTTNQAMVERVRSAAARASAVAVGVLGSRAVLDAVTTTVQAGKPWPAGGPEDPWPKRGNAYGVPANASGATLSVALRIDDGARAIAAARSLGGAASARLEARLASLATEFRVERVTATTRPRGACLRIDLSSSDTNVSARAAAWAAIIAEQEAWKAAPKGAGAWWDIEDGVLRAADPREAAAVAAWRALSGRLVANEPVRFVRFAAAGSEQIASELQRAATRRDSALEVRSRVESGQGEFWLLAASPCGVFQESAAESGLTALTLIALSQAAAERHPGVAFEPWISADVVGLLAHGPRTGPGESGTAHASRIADALGWAIAGTRLSGQDVAAARATLTAALPVETGGVWSAALEALSPGHPSWLEPRGSFAAISGHSGHAADARRRTWLGEPLRLAVLANGDASQGNAAEAAFSNWLAPGIGEAGRCPKQSARLPKSGELQIARAKPGQSIVAVHLNPGTQADAEWVTFLLNRPGGLLDQALQGTRLGRAQARLLGGELRAALVIEVHAFDENQKDAVAQVRALLARLASGALSPKDVEVARAHFARVRLGRSLDPRQRLIKTWGVAPDTEPTAASIRRFLQLNLAAPRQLVVRPEDD
jgi:hypothetical protein